MKTVIALTFPRYKGFSSLGILSGFRRDFIDSWTNKDVDGGFFTYEMTRSQAVKTDTKAA